MSGNRLYHTASTPTLQEKPTGSAVALEAKCIVCHARQICAISMSNQQHLARTIRLNRYKLVGDV